MSSNATPEYAAYASKAISPTMDAFADFILAEVFGGKLPNGLDEQTFRRSVALGGSLRQQFQKSEMWKSDPRNYLANVEANREVKAAEKAERAKAAAAKAVERAKAAEQAAKAAAAKAAARAAELAAKAEAA
jgi:hypothetical protein